MLETNQRLKRLRF